MTWTLEHHGKGTFTTSIVIQVVHEVGTRLHGTNQTSGKIYQQSICRNNNRLHYKMGGSKSFEKQYNKKHCQIFV